MAKEIGIELIPIMKNAGRSLAKLARRFRDGILLGKSIIVLIRKAAQLKIELEQMPSLKDTCRSSILTILTGARKNPFYHLLLQITLEIAMYFRKMRFFVRSQR